MSISQPPFQSILVDANDRVQTPWAQWFSQLQPILQSVVASGPTSGRPTQNLYIGYPYFDTTIDQMVYWNGVIWVTYAPSTTGTSILKGNGSGGFNNSVAGIDFAPATSGSAILYGNGFGGFSSVSIGSGVTFAGGVLSATGSGGTVTSVIGTAPIASSGGTAPAISISQAGTAADGYLSSIDWNTFNNKGSGTVTAVTGSGNIASSGGTTPNITFTGTLPIANGGTNGTATPTAGAVAVGNGTQYAFTAAGSAGQVLTSNGSTVPTWATVATGIGTTGYWGSFWDTTNQTAASTTVAYLITLNSTDADSNGVSIVSSSRITFAYAGAYNLQFSAQFVNTDSQIHNAQVWLRLNGTDVTDSMGTVAIQQKHGSIDGVNIVSWNYVLKLSAGDYLQLVWNVDSTQVSLQTLPAGTSPTHPESPSVIVTATPVTEVGIGYYNLTSVSSVAIATGSQTFTTNLSNISTAFTVGTRIRVAYVTAPANYMEGVITSFSGTTLVVNVDSIGGSGTYANWTISVAGIQGSNGVTSITGTANQVIASASTGAVTLSLPQNINSGAAPTFLGTNFTGTASLNINGTVGATTASTGAFTTLTSSLGATLQGVTIGRGGSGASATNTALGANALANNEATGLNNTAIGSNSLQNNKLGTTNVAAGDSALQFNTTAVATFGAITGGTGYTDGAYTNVALTYVSGSTATTYPAVNITVAGGIVTVCTLVVAANGTSGGTGFKDISTVMTCASIGAGTGFAISPATLVSGGGNSAIGSQALRLNSTGVNNCALGVSSLIANTTGFNNTSSGLQAMFSNQTGANNSAYGSTSLRLNVAGNSNSAFGRNALTSTTGSANLGLGTNAGSGITTGSNNVVLGGYAGAVAPILATGSNYVVLSDGVGNIRTYYDASGNKVNYGVQATSAAAPTIASATTIAPTKAITFISGVTPIVTITAPSPISLGGGQITLIPTGIFTTTTAGNIALASTAVVSRALIMTYDVTTAKWYPSY